MERPSIDPAAAIPDADLHEQHLDATPDPLTGTIPDEQHDPGATDQALVTADQVLFADEADVVEQAIDLPVDVEEDYPNARTLEGFDV